MARDPSDDRPSDDKKPGGADEPGSGGVDLDRVDAYDYELPDELIAVRPADRREQSRLLVADRQAHTIAHRRFADIVDYLGQGDLLVFNDTQVIPARILTRKETGGLVELLVLDLVEPSGAGRWSEPAEDGVYVFRCMTRSSRPLRRGMVLHTQGAPGPAFYVVDAEAGRATVEAAWHEPALALLEAVGELPLPPYIVKRREALAEQGQAVETSQDRSRYQTVYAAEPGAVAAPTAGLHFSPELLDTLAGRGVERAFLTLRVGPGTFRPVSTDRLSEHPMHAEEYAIPEGLAEAIAAARRVIAVGTTSMRALEAEARRPTPFEPGVRQTDIFLKPGSQFRACDGLVTNFHLPRSTLLALVAGFAGYGFMRRIYDEAIAERYRFYSYGDAMLIQ